RVVEDMDHKNVNLDVPWMEGHIASAENIIVAIWDRLVDHMPAGVKLAKLTLWETPRHYVEYTGE
ncbi:MAG: 6-carboxytetrahydropterin synthase, partial [Thermoplasmata archaeon]